MNKLPIQKQIIINAGKNDNKKTPQTTQIHPNDIEQP